MECARIRVDFPDYIYEELPSARRREIEAHLGGCENCAAELARMREVLTCLDEAAPATPPAVAIPILVRQAAEFSRAARRWRWLAAGVGTLAAGILVLALTNPEVHWQGRTLMVSFLGSPAPAVPGDGSSPQDPWASGPLTLARAHQLEQSLDQLERNFEQLSLRHRQLLITVEEVIGSLDRLPAAAEPDRGPESELDRLLADLGEP